jgi:uncharacterized membrane protein HdeD (DUF308 family)
METTAVRDPESLMDALAERWWVPVVRGLAAILFGVLTLMRPGTSLFALVLLWGIYAVVDGVFNIVLAAYSGRAGGRWGWFLFEGLVSVAAGVLTFAWPSITGIVLLALIATWAVLTGVAEIAAAVWLRKLIAHEWVLGLSGLVSIAFGFMLMARPRAGALAVAWVIGVYAIAFGALLVGLGARFYRRLHTAGRMAPASAAPTPAS